MSEIHFKSEQEHEYSFNKWIINANNKQITKTKPHMPIYPRILYLQIYLTSFSLLLLEISH